MQEKMIKPEQIFSARIKALQNAKEIYEDAKILFEAGRWARAFFLIQIATEELGKYGILSTTSISAIRGKLNWKYFWKRLKNHRNKTKQVLLFENFHNFINQKKGEIVSLEENTKYASLQENIKMKSLYSDIDPNGSSWKPSEIISKEICNIGLQLLEKRINLVESFEIEVAEKFPINQLTKERIQEFYTEIGLTELLKKEKE